MDPSVVSMAARATSRGQVLPEVPPGPAHPAALTPGGVGQGAPAAGPRVPTSSPPAGAPTAGSCGPPRRAGRPRPPPAGSLPPPATGGRRRRASAATPRPACATGAPPRRPAAGLSRPAIPLRRAAAGFTAAATLLRKFRALRKFGGAMTPPNLRNKPSSRADVTGAAAGAVNARRLPPPRRPGPQSVQPHPTIVSGFPSPRTARSSRHAASEASAAPRTRTPAAARPPAQRAGVIPLLRREFAFDDSRESLERQWLSVGCRHLR